MKNNPSKFEYNSGQSWSEELRNLRVMTYLNWVCAKVGLKACGNQMERYFEPYENNRTCKYDRYFHGTTPNPDTIILIEEKVESSAKVFSSPLWSALHYLSTNEKQCDELFINLPLDLQRIIFEQERDNFNQLVRAGVGRKAIKRISEFGGLSALACLIALRAENDKSVLYASIKAIDMNIFQMVINLCILGELSNMTWPIFNFIKQQLFNTKKVPSNYWLIEESELNSLIEIRDDALKLANESKLIRYSVIVYPFLFWFSRGDQDLIAEEMKKLHQENATFRDQNELGVYWLIAKINSHYPRSERITYHLKS